MIRSCALLFVLSSLVISADPLTAVIDAFCGVPKIRIPLSPDPSTMGVLEGSDTLFGSDWQPLLQLTGGNGHHDWMDPAGRSQARRFYRMSRVPRPPLEMMANFRLTDHLGESHELFREGDARGVVLVFTTAATLPSVWNQLRPVIETNSDSGLLFWIVDPVDDRETLADAAKAAGISQPILHDPAHLVSRSYGAGRAGESILIDGATAAIFYRGPIEDHLPFTTGTGAGVRQTYLSDAIKQFLTDQPALLAFAPNSGPLLPLPQASVADYATVIAPLLQTKCVTCHKPGDIGTFAMVDHASVATRSSLIRANVLEGLMPPWHADPAHQRFSNDFSLTTKEQETLVAWIDAGAPKGLSADPLAAVPPAPNEWPLGKPDLILKISKQTIQADGEMPYTYLFITNTLKTNAWIRAAAVKPGNRAVVHHALIFQVNPGSLASMFSQIAAIQGGLAGYFAGFVPGMKQVFYPERTGKKLVARSILVFQMHYTPNGSETTDTTELGLYLTSTPPDTELTTGAIYSTAISIAPGEKRNRIAAEKTFPTAIDVHELSPHMHYRGYAMRFEAVLPDGSSQVLLNVPKYDFAWQTLYRLEQPIRLPAGSKIKLTGAFDNSRFNPFNPNPAVQVKFGEQTGDEMFVGYLNYSVAR